MYPLGRLWISSCRLQRPGIRSASDQWCQSPACKVSNFLKTEEQCGHGHRSPNGAPRGLEGLSSRSIRFVSVCSEKAVVVASFLFACVNSRNRRMPQPDTSHLASRPHPLLRVSSTFMRSLGHCTLSLIWQLLLLHTPAGGGRGFLHGTCYM